VGDLVVSAPGQLREALDAKAKAARDGMGAAVTAMVTSNTVSVPAATRRSGRRS